MKRGRSPDGLPRAVYTIAGIDFVCGQGLQFDVVSNETNEATGDGASPGRETAPGPQKERGKGSTGSGLRRSGLRRALVSLRRQENRPMEAQDGPGAAWAGAEVRITPKSKKRAGCSRPAPSRTSRTPDYTEEQIKGRRTNASTAAPTSAAPIRASSAGQAIPFSAPVRAGEPPMTNWALDRSPASQPGARPGREALGHRTLKGCTPCHDGPGFVGRPGRCASY